MNRQAKFERKISLVAPSLTLSSCESTLPCIFTATRAGASHSAPDQADDAAPQTRLRARLLLRRGDVGLIEVDVKRQNLIDVSAPSAIKLDDPVKYVSHYKSRSMPSAVSLGQTGELISGYSTKCGATATVAEPTLHREIMLKQSVMSPPCLVFETSELSLGLLNHAARYRSHPQRRVAEIRVEAPQTFGLFPSLLNKTAKWTLSDF